MNFMNKDYAIIVVITTIFLMVIGYNLANAIFGYQIFLFLTTAACVANLLIFHTRLELTTIIWSTIVLILPGALLTTGSVLQIIGRTVQQKNIGLDVTANLLFGIFYLGIGYLAVSAARRLHTKN